MLPYGHVTRPHTVCVARFVVPHTAHAASRLWFLSSEPVFWYSVPYMRAPFWSRSLNSFHVGFSCRQTWL